MTVRTLEEVMRDAGFEVVGPCERLSQREGLLERSELLDDFTAAEADILGNSMLLVRAQAGQPLIVEGDTSDWLMLLLAGTVDVGKRKVDFVPLTDDTEAPERIAVVREGSVLGEMSMFDGEPRYASCTALSAVEAAVLSRGAVRGLILRHPGVGAKLLVKLTQVLSRRLRNTSNQLIKVLRSR
ncbi:Crp/Fnr family transcriptional regulator [Ramlibacter sp.]|uniref:Crp/Fnr family transcriptional regulator n=1 Tax=Ramlibacter sp. TaxID=1917967 RepID=UPI003D0A2E15